MLQLAASSTPGRTPNITTPTLPNLPNVALSRRKPVELGEPFAGDSALYPAWRLTIAYKLRVDEEFIGDVEARWNLIWTNLYVTKVQPKAVMCFVNGAQYGYDTECFLVYFDPLFTDEHRQATAHAELDLMRQAPTESFAAFYVAFEQKLATAGGQGWPDDIKLLKLRNAITKRMRDIGLNCGILRYNYIQAVSAYRGIASDIESYQLEEKLRYR